MQRLGNNIYRLLCAIAVLTALYGWWIAYWAPDNKILVFMIYLAAALLVWFGAKFLRFILGRILDRRGMPQAPDQDKRDNANLWFAILLAPGFLIWLIFNLIRFALSPFARRKPGMRA